MVKLPLAYQSGDTLLAELDPEHYITDKKRVVSKLTAENRWVKPVLAIPATKSLELGDGEYAELRADWERFQTFINTGVTKHLQGQHDQRSHAGSRATIETPSFSDEEYDAISAYTGSATVQINHKLRGLSRTRGIQPARGVWVMSDEKIDNVVKNLDSAISKSKLIKQTVMERDIPATSLKSGLFGSAVGKTISDKGFLSLKSGTSNIPPLKGFVKLRVTAPSGTTALDMSFINPNAMGEIIFPRDTKIKITSVSGGGADTIVRGEIVG